MKNRKSEPLYIFLHMPKCAGTTFRTHIEANLTREETLALYVNIDKRFRDRDYLQEYIGSLPQSRKNSLKLIYGHEVHYGIHEWLGREGLYFTFLREPVARTISWYNYRRQQGWGDQRITQDFIEKGNTPTLEEWLSASPWVWNEMTGYFADYGYLESKENYEPHELAEILDKFFYVGLTETFDTDALYLYWLLNIRKVFFKAQNISTKYFDPEERERVERLILETNNYDRKIYEIAAQRHSEFRDISYFRKLALMRALRLIAPVRRRLSFGF